jgi:hypothetical protein
VCSSLAFPKAMILICDDQCHAVSRGWFAIWFAIWVSGTPRGQHSLTSNFD